ncbi:hypothetical protein [Okeania sp. SIO3B5]|nr:hypothetical protein [Okeania sp. SIO3B5]
MNIVAPDEQYEELSIRKLSPLRAKESGVRSQESEVRINQNVF